MSQEARQRFKVGDMVRHWGDGPNTPLRTVMGFDGEWVQVTLTGTGSGTCNADTLTLVHREWIDAAEWPDDDRQDLYDAANEPVDIFGFGDCVGIAFGYLIALLTSCPVSGWGYKEPELVAVMLPRTYVENCASERSVAAVFSTPLAVACRAALEES